MRLAIVVAGFYEELAQRLVSGARDVFASAGEVDELAVDGAYELPGAAMYAAQSGRYDGIACLGAVIRGETDHYDYVCSAATRGIQEVQLQTGVPCGFGVLTVDSMEQAIARSGGGHRHAGRSAAEAVLTLIRLREQLR